jgi:hypothetical protein
MVVVNAAVAKALNCLMADAFLKIQAQQEATERLIQAPTQHSCRQTQSSGQGWVREKPSGLVPIRL